MSFKIISYKDKYLKQQELNQKALSILEGMIKTVDEKMKKKLNKSMEYIRGVDLPKGVL